MRLVFFMVILLALESCQSKLWSQDYEPQRITLNQWGRVLSFHVTNKEIDPDRNRYYYYFSNQTLDSLEGGYTGKVLDGTYEELTEEGKLILQGSFREGLKGGTWKYWNGSNLIAEIQFKEGLRNGYTRNYTNGQPTKLQQYKNGVVDGKSIYYNHTDTTHLQVNYKQGVANDSTFIQKVPEK